jgi:hypothetical protein
MGRSTESKGSLVKNIERAMNKHAQDLNPDMAYSAMVKREEELGGMRILAAKLGVKCSCRFNKTAHRTICRCRTATSKRKMSGRGKRG